MLTIAIPTYNRNRLLHEHLSHLLPQLDGRCRLLIIDNASDVPVEQTLAPLLAQFPQARVEIRRNRANIGANANILRCFEWCETEWLWTLSDDDVPKPDAIKTVFEHIEARPECVFFNFGVEHSMPRSKTITTRGAVDFLNKIDSFGNTIFLSTNVYRTAQVLGSLKFAYHYIYASVPQFVVVLKSLGPDDACCFSHIPIVTFRLAAKDDQWSRVTLALGLRTILEMPMEPRLRAALARQITAFDEYFLQTRPLVHQLILQSLSNHDRRGALYLYDQLRHRRYSTSYYGDKRLRRRLEAYVWRSLIKHPHLGLQFISLAHRLKKRPLDEVRVMESVSDRL